MSNPKTQTQYARLFAGLENIRWDYMRILADAAEDEGNTTLAVGWRWLAKHHCWPRSTSARFEGRYYSGCFEWEGYPGKDEDWAEENVTSENGWYVPVSYSLPSGIALRIKSPLVKLGRRSETFPRLLCRSKTTLLELTAQAAGEWLASQR